jgi:hypothetical protein
MLPAQLLFNDGQRSRCEKIILFKAGARMDFSDLVEAILAKRIATQFK